MAQKEEQTNSDVEEKKSTSPILPQQLPWRFIRLHPRFSAEETLEALEKIDQILSIRPVSWCLSSKLQKDSQQNNSSLFPFYAIPGSTNLPSTIAYQSGRIYGQDVSSGQAVSVLLEDLPQQHPPDSNPIRILDLCASPGLKLCAMADFCFARGYRNVTIVGVDISRDRLHLCQRLLQKYQSHHSSNNDTNTFRIQLYWGDGTTWGSSSSIEQHELVYDSHVAAQHLQLQDGQKRRNKSAKHRERRLLQQAQLESSHTLFHYVLVDAECSTDGSIAHRGGQPTATPKLLQLQARLLQRGFDMLQPGSSGSLVYATCSLDDDQNSGVVEGLLTVRPTARVVPLQWKSSDDTTTSATYPLPSFVRSGRLPGTIQFLPSTTSRSSDDDKHIFGSGLFVSKIQRIAQDAELSK